MGVGADFALCFAFFLLTLTASTRADTLKCHFREASHTFAPTLYTCFVQNNKLFKHSRASIDAVEGQHAVDMADANVRGISILSIYNMKFLPGGIENFFSNLIVLQIWNTDYEVIHQEDLKGFTRLRYLLLSNNQLRAIEGDLFAFNGDLEFLWLDFNKISRIDSAAFDHLSKLKSLKLFGNACINGDRATRDGVIELVKRVAERGECSSSETALSRLDEIEEAMALMSVENEKLRRENEEAGLKMANLSAEGEKLTLESERLREELQQVAQFNAALGVEREISAAALQKMSTENQSLRQRNERLEKSVGNLEITVETLTKSFQQLQANHGALIRRMNNFNN